MANTVRTGIVGCGGIARTHAAALANLPESVFSACCDIDGDRARALATTHGVPHVFTDVHAMLGSGTVDAVLVCTPHPSHAMVVIAAAEAGVHVLCEKPLTIDLGESDRMIAAATKAGIRFGGIFQRRFWPAAQRIRRAIDNGKLGRITYGECQTRIWRPREYYARDAWRGKWATEGGGALMNQAVHAIDLFQWYMGPIVEIYGHYATLAHGNYIDVEDTVVATALCANGAMGTITAVTTMDPNFGFKVGVHGDSGAYVSVWEQPEGTEGIIDMWTVRGEEEHADILAPGRTHVPGFPAFHQMQIQEFLQAILADREPAVTGAEARKALEIILAIYQSQRSGQPVRLPLTGPLLPPQPAL